MRTTAAIVMAACMVLLPFTVLAESDIPPVAQPLVREGDFAIELAPLFGLGSPETEAEAEDLLSRSGVLPANGWLSDYPMTPDILFQLQEAAARAARNGKLGMTPEETGRVLFALASKMGLPVPAGQEPENEASAVASQEPVINNYYIGYGPPIITYYAPPAQYGYLYTWVPFPSWWYGYRFPGYYICNTFSTTIVVNSRTVYVRNRFVEPVTRRVVHVVPSTITERNIIRPVLRIRTEDGRHFTNLREMRTHWGAPAGNDPRAVKVRPERRPGYSTPEKRRDAARIYSNAIERRDSARQEQPVSSRAVQREDQRQKRSMTATPGRSRKAEGITAPRQQKQNQGTGTITSRRAAIPGQNVAARKNVRVQQKQAQKQVHKQELRPGRSGSGGRND